MLNISKKMLALNILASQMILFFFSFLLWKLMEFLGKGIVLTDLVKISIDPKIILSVVGGSSLLLILQLVFIRYVSSERLFDEINILLIKKFSSMELIPIFFLGALSEELLFRGIIQPFIGIIFTSLLFTVVHYRYRRKVFILLEVFLMGIILGISYFVTSVIWVPVFCHFFVNFLTAFLIKKGIIHYEVADS